ncbi:MAG: response regulator [Proteobacteria bacterium]|nr:response regulator [Pseudomonadota bacterium]MBS0464581.1 response regulator [Pseudomonadota bacterium]
MHPTHLLLVEDDPISRGFLTLALQAMPATVVDVAGDGAQALTLAGRTAHALWVLDAHLPDIHGAALLAELRALRLGVPALCLTAEADPARLAYLQAQGFAEVACKPLSIPALHAAVRRALAGVPDGMAVPVWDDAQALRALGDNAAAVQAMRGLFVAELPSQATTIAKAIGDGDLNAARGVLHKLKASCGFVGCPRLLEAIHALATAPTDPAALRRFREQAAAVHLPG